MSLIEKNRRVAKNLILASGTQEYGIDVSKYLSANKLTSISSEFAKANVVIGTTSGFPQELAAYETLFKDLVILRGPVPSFTKHPQSPTMSFPSGVEFIDRVVRAAFKMENEKPRFVLSSYFGLAVVCGEVEISLGWDMRDIPSLSTKATRVDFFHSLSMYDTFERKEQTAVVRRIIQSFPTEETVYLNGIMMSVHKCMSIKKTADPIVKKMTIDAVANLKATYPQIGPYILA